MKLLIDSTDFFKQERNFIMKFRITCGIHSEGGVIYEAGDNDIIETDVDLIRAFGPTKFERVSVPLDEVESHVTFSHDITDQFKGCKEMGYQVYHEANNYFVVSIEKGRPVHETKITDTETVRTVLEGLK